MARSLSYSDAVRLLGGTDSRVVGALDKITGALMFGGSLAVPGLLGWFDAKAEFARLSHELVRGLSERRSGLSRFGRTERLEAAHTVIVITAFFEGMAETPLPFRYADLELTQAEQIAVAGAGFVDGLLSAGSLLPAPQSAYEDTVAALCDYYADLAEKASAFITGLAVWDRLAPADREVFHDVVRGVPDRARARYEELFRRLAVDFPEVACWHGQLEHQATRAAVRDVDIALARLESTLAAISTGRAPDDRRAGLARAYQAALRRPIVESGETPEGLDVPTLGDAYVSPRFRVADVAADFRPSDEGSWAALPMRDELQEFLAGHLTSPQATRAPLLVLGQPGSGKSVLTRVLAARLPAADFLPVRVILRDVPAAADLQDQLEMTVRTATGERVEWPALVRSAGDALPVVILDGFDELLQASGVSQTDYLMKVAAFQLREAEHDRPVAVIVTSRTAVADKASSPAGTVALRLEPFDDVRIAAWLDTWNATNAHHFARRDITPLAAETVLARRALAEQPLLLLMLALYDADDNALLRMTADLNQHQLYETLLRDFAGREVRKHRAGMSERDVGRAVDEELRRLSVVAFAMFNRASLWVTEADLESDLAALFGPPRRAAGPDLRTPLRPAELTLGRFFFIHRARSLQGDTRTETYEFLHATFGEFLVARLTWLVVCDMGAREAASTMALTTAPATDDLLRALLSCEPLCLRGSIMEFLEEMMSLLDEPRRAALVELLVDLFRVVHESPPAQRYAEYRPRRLPEPGRYAAYSANLVLLILCAAGTIRASDLYGTSADAVHAWHSQSLLWRSQFSEDGWTSLVGTVIVDRLWNGPDRDVELSLSDGTPRTPAVDPYWTFGIGPDHPDRAGTAFTYFNLNLDALRRKAYFQCAIEDDVALHALEPLSASGMDMTVSTFTGWWADASPSTAHALIDLWTLPLRQVTPEERRAAYERCAHIATGGFPPWDVQLQRGYAVLVLDRLATDREATPPLAADILDVFAPLNALVGADMARCGLAFLGKDRDIDQRLADILGAIMPGADPVPFAEILVRLHELGLEDSTVGVDFLKQLMVEVGRERPDLPERLRRAVGEWT